MSSCGVQYRTGRRLFIVLCPYFILISLVEVTGYLSACMFVRSVVPLPSQVSQPLHFGVSSTIVRSQLHRSTTNALYRSIDRFVMAVVFCCCNSCFPRVDSLVVSGTCLWVYYTLRMRQRGKHQYNGYAMVTWKMSDRHRWNYLNRERMSGRRKKEEVWIKMQEGQIRINKEYGELWLIKCNTN